MPASLHIVSFDIPYPPNYGGVIDVYYKLKALKRAGSGVVLHCFEYGRERSSVLEELCDKVYYYRRNTGLKSNLSFQPYIVRSRISEELVVNLLKDKLPILFEGLHTCGVLSDPRLQGRMMIYRESNIEHHYYLHLFHAEKNLLKRLFFLAESIRLRHFQQVLNHASVMLTVSREDCAYLASRFPHKRVLYLPSFHGKDEPGILTGRGEFALYQGKLSVAENSRAAAYLISDIWKEEYPDLIIAGMDPPDWLIALAHKKPNVRIESNPSNQRMDHLIRHAHVHLMVTFQPTGLKLKLLNALFSGRFCLVNPGMLTGTDLAPLCAQASSVAEFREAIPGIFGKTFTEEMISERKQILGENYSDAKNCNRLLEILTLP